jgi:putative ABC transport system ATP-binding protein
MSLIVLQDIVKQYQIGSTVSTVLKGIDLTVNQGELLAIVGASGSGKSTLMNIIGLLDKPDSGRYCIKDKDTSGLTSDALAHFRNRYIGFVFQQFNLLPRLNAMQNVALPLTYRGDSKSTIHQRVEEVLSRVGMLDYKEHRPTQLSGGQQQRIAIARALVTEPEVILADEPTGALDTKTGHDIMSLFKALHAEGRTIILVTHDEKIAKQCERRITFSDGSIIKDDASTKLGSSELLIGEA